MRRRLIGIGLFLLLMLAFPMRLAATTVDEIASQLICQCGCYTVLNNCVHGECMVRDSMTKSIELKLAQGQSPEQIIQAFVTQYGEVVLAAPPKQGFNLTAWITPFAAIIFGAGIIWLAIKRWVKRGQKAVPVKVRKVAEEDEEKYQLRLEQELKEYGERGFR
ncbi:MAG: cytochrome c-type biogenesis protein CcmH [Chloroflexi bacterium]|nr:cytochrome c-type biogenesis protein CcmH [Chloroflexota bacterium]